MNLSETWAEIEEELRWRQDEIRFFSNQLSNIDTPDDQNQFRRAIVLLLYAHFEGFCKFAFLTYIKVINGENLHCKDANFSIAASSLTDYFDALRNPENKTDYFRNALPEDRKLHRFARDKEFIENMQHYDHRPLVIPDDVVDTESNLKPVVLKKMLFVLGFNHDAFTAIEGNIHLLLRRDNRHHF